MRRGPSRQRNDTKFELACTGQSRKRETGQKEANVSSQTRGVEQREPDVYIPNT